MTRRELLTSFIRPKESVCDDESTKNNQVCQDPDLRQKLESGDSRVREWFIEEQKVINIHNNAAEAAQGAKCLVAPVTIASLIMWLHNRRKDVALKGNIEYSNQ